MAPRSAGQKVSLVTSPVTIDLQDPPGQVITRIDPQTTTPTASGSHTPSGAVTPKQYYPIYGATYARHEHHGVHAVGWEPISFGKITLSRFELQTLPSSSKFLKFIANAAEPKPHTPWDYLSAEQQMKLMKSMAQTNKDLRVKLSNAKRKQNVADLKISEHRRIMMLLSTNDIPGLRRLLTVFNETGGQPSRNYSSSRAGTYCNWCPRLLYALQKSHGLASVSTVRRYQKIPKLVASIGIPTKEEINANISSFLAPEIKPPPKCINGHIPGNILMVDGVALETKCRYCPYRDAILGLCREHSHHVNTKVDSLESVEEVRAALAEDIKDPGKVCFGSDATVVAIAPYAQSDHYTPVPIVVSPSDKTEKGVDLAQWLQVVLDA
ncbi:hypothetical protein B0H14DRAFT_2581744 [Mycena olivaceomarginata]|nr:hypothetical protein B0H14DRAFT_2581744 [Mycena olivaceomarginata]